MTLHEEAHAARESGHNDRWMDLQNGIERERSLVIDAALLPYEIANLERDAIKSHCEGLLLAADDLAIVGRESDRLSEATLLCLMPVIIDQIAGDYLLRRCIATEFAELKAFDDAPVGGVLDRAIDQALDVMRPYLPAEYREGRARET